MPVLLRVSQAALLNDAPLTYSSEAESRQGAIRYVRVFDHYVDGLTS